MKRYYLLILSLCLLSLFSCSPVPEITISEPSKAPLTAEASVQTSEASPESHTVSDPTPEKTVLGQVRVNAPSGLNLRSQPNTLSEILLKLPDGTILDVSARADGWLKVSFEEKIGYVSERYTEVYPLPTASYKKNLSFSGSVPHLIIDGFRVFDPRKIDPQILKEVSIQSVVNKCNALPDQYVPQDLVDITTNGKKKLQLRREAAEAWERLQKDAAAQGLKLVAVSAFRTKAYQTDLFERYLTKDPNDAILYSAYPRRSEHEMGLALDVSNTNALPVNFFTSPQGKFMQKHAHEYGFILRYPDGKQEITGYGFEAWHFRYVGQPLAEEIYQKNLTLEEYYGLNSVH